MAVGYFPGCSLHSTAQNYDMSTREVCKKLGVDLEEIPDWNCCGSTPAHQTDHLLALALPARNLAIAERAGMKDVLAPCAACFNHLKTAAVECKKDAGLKRKVEQAIEMELQGKVEVRNILDLVMSKVGVDKVKAKVVRSLKGLKVAPYYGCLLTRPHKITEFDHPTNPTSMNILLQAAGAEVVDWGAKTDCCGASYSLTRPEVVVSLSGKIIHQAVDAGADVIATACPMCMSNLDLRQPAIAKQTGRSAHIPVLYITELLGLALGIPEQKLGLGKHIISTAKVQRRVG